MIEEFEETAGNKNSDKHRKQSHCAQVSFAKEGTEPVTTTDQTGNPFSEYRSDLLALDNKDVIDSSRLSEVLTKTA